MKQWRGEPIEQSSMRENSPNKKDSLRSLFSNWAGVDSNHRTLSGTDLQSVAFSHSATYPYKIFTYFFIIALDET